MGLAAGHDEEKFAPDLTWYMVVHTLFDSPNYCFQKLVAVEYSFEMFAYHNSIKIIHYSNINSSYYQLLNSSYYQLLNSSYYQLL